MFKFIRRVSSSLLPRPDRPWRDDATSNAPTIGRKRRFSFTKDDDDSASTSVKKARVDHIRIEGSTSPITQVPQLQEGDDLKSVTQVVELEDDKVDSSLSPSRVPIPDSPDGTSHSDAITAQQLAAAPEGDTAEQKGAQDHSDADSVASSSGKGGEVYEQEQLEDDDPNDDTKAAPTSAASLPVEVLSFPEGTPTCDATPAPTEINL